MATASYCWRDKREWWGLWRTRGESASLLMGRLSSELPVWGALTPCFLREVGNLNFYEKLPSFKCEQLGQKM